MCDAFILSKVKNALRVTDEDFDGEIADLIDSAMLDLNVCGVDGNSAVHTNPLVRTAIITYCKLHWGQCENFDDMSKSYFEQKAKLQMSTGYTIWTGQV